MRNIGITNEADRQDKIDSVLLFTYFLTILLQFTEENSLYRTLPYQIISIVCVIVFIFPKMVNRSLKVRVDLAVFITLCAVTGIFNFLIIKNSSILNVIECSFFNTIIACMIIEKKINTKWIEYACYAYIIVFIYRIIRMGLFERITRFSNNQVSVALLIPVVLYYVLKDINSEELSILPALATWIISLLSRGRTGIVTCTILFVAVFLKYYKAGSLAKEHENRKKLRKILLRLLLIIGCTFILYSLFSQYSEQIFGKFIDQGLDNSARQIMWSEYLENAGNNFKYLLLGVPKRLLIMGEIFNNNTHNSFISIHANNGITMFVFCIVLLARAISYAFKNKYYIYLTCIIVFCLRSFFDNMFWGTWGTTTFMVLIFIPLLRKKSENREVQI